MSLEFETSRLKVFERSTDIEQSELSVLCLRIPELLTPSVVEHLPPYFHGIESPSDAEHWFYKMVSESRLFVVKHKKPDSIIGLVFAFVENSHD
ncbi:MAG: N-acetyltransferase, partial [Gammaproteobacteria bacterium]|nr:N-acetyltransferase [Gammaproteobacteria bacterium]